MHVIPRTDGRTDGGTTGRVDPMSGARRTMSRAWSCMVLTIGYCNVLYDVFAPIINNVERTRRRAIGLCALRRRFGSNRPQTAVFTRTPACDSRRRRWTRTTRSAERVFGSSETPSEAASRARCAVHRSSGLGVTRRATVLGTVRIPFHARARERRARARREASRGVARRRRTRAHGWRGREARRRRRR